MAHTSHPFSPFPSPTTPLIPSFCHFPSSSSSNPSTSPLFSSPNLTMSCWSPSTFPLYFNHHQHGLGGIMPRVKFDGYHTTHNVLLYALSKYLECTVHLKIYILLDLAQTSSGFYMFGPLETLFRFLWTHTFLFDCYCTEALM